MYRINIQKQKHNFSATHLITLEEECETLHGHNYYTMVEMKGELDDNSYLMDFKVAKSELDKICKMLDHKVLMATQNRHLKIRETEKEFEVQFKSKKYVFPSEDVVLLPINNTTVEKLSEYICGRLIESLRKMGVLKNISSIEVGVEETAGQMASFKVEL